MATLILRAPHVTLTYCYSDCRPFDLIQGGMVTLEIYGHNIWKNVPQWTCFMINVIIRLIDQIWIFISVNGAKFQGEFKSVEIKLLRRFHARQKGKTNF